MLQILKIPKRQIEKIEQEKKKNNDSTIINEIENKVLNNTLKNLISQEISETKNEILDQKEIPDTENKLLKIKRWSLDRLKQEGKKLYNSTITYEKIDPKTLTHISEIRPLCNCGFSWPTTIYNHISLKNGCPWCLNEAKNVRKYTIEMIEFISSKIHDIEYVFDDNNKIKTYSSTEKINVWCGIEDHKPFNDTITRIVSRAKNKSDRTKGCLECSKLQIKEPHIRWRNNLKTVIEKGGKIYNNMYSYDDNKSENILNCESEINIKCLNIKNNGQICGHNFVKTINQHINHNARCTQCFKQCASHNHKQWTMERLHENIVIKQKEGLFTYENVKNMESITSKTEINISCNICREEFSDYVFSRTIKEHFINDKGCRRCSGRLKWDEKRLRDECEEKEKQGEYKYNNINFKLVKGGQTKINIICIKCKNEGCDVYTFDMTIARHFISNCGCQRCAKNDH